MSIFDSIKRAIFGRGATPAASPAPAPKPAAAASKGPATASAPAARPAPSGAPQPQEPVDVEAVLNGLAAKNPQKLNWQTSIVDLMKLLSLDSSFENRKALAKELGFTGDTGDSAALNVWLHKQVMKKLGETGGKVPASFRD